VRPHTLRLTGSELFFRVAEELIDVAKKGDPGRFVERVVELYREISSTRPASMASLNLLRAVASRLLERGFEGLVEFIEGLVKEYDSALQRAAEIAARRVVSGEKIMTTSNSLAVRRFLKSLVELGKKVELYVSESRPGREGLYLAEYAESLGIPTTLFVDSAARFFIKEVDKVFIGAEAIAANGAVVSKIGAGLVSLVSKEARKRVFVIAPTMKFSYETIHGELLKLPEGGSELLVDVESGESLPEGFVARVPLYEVIPPEYVDGIATEYGLIAPQAIPILLRNIYGTYPISVKPFDALISELHERYGGGA
jgi:translation initiation factor eIF-2B subunit delta